MMNNMNKGYTGFSMSNRAVAAYDNGEMPKSKWTKKVMIATICEYLDENDLALDVDLNKMKKDEVFKEFFQYSSWHHTSMHCNCTNFYEMDVETVKSHSRPMTEEELAERARLEEIEDQKFEERMAKIEAEAKAKKKSKIVKTIGLKNKEYIRHPLQQQSHVESNTQSENQEEEITCT